MRLIDANEFRQRFNKVYDESSDEQKRALLKILVELELTKAQEVTPKIWHDAKVELPKETCEVVGVFGGTVMNTGYSSKHRMFNVSDYDDDLSGAFTDCYVWAYPKDLGLSYGERFEVTVDKNFVKGAYENA